MAKSLQDKSFQTLAATVKILLVLTVLLQPCLSAPSTGRVKTTSSGEKAAQKKPPVWHNPCGALPSGKSLGGHATRHVKPKSIKTVRQQFKITMKHFRNNEKRILNLYTEVKESLGDQIKYDWLPQDQFLWYWNEVRNINDKPQKMAMVLKEFHSSLQEILITFLEMKKFNLEHNEPLHKIRTKLITEMSNKVKQLLCEAENAILNESAGLPDRHTTDIVTWDSNPDHTTVLVQDWGVFALYKNFLQNWQCIMDDLMSKTKRKIALKMCRPLLKTRN